MPGKGRVWEKTFSTSRIETLVDGIFAVAMTILVLDIRAPSSTVRHDRETFELFLVGLADPLVNFGISFLLLSFFWIWHHRQSIEIKRTDPVHITVNLLFLAGICFVPFSTSLMSQFLDLWEADLIFHLNIFVLGFLLWINWWYSTDGLRLVDSDIDPQKVRSGKLRASVPPLMALMGMASSFFVLGDSNIIYLLTPIAVRLAGKGFQSSGGHERDIREQEQKMSRR